MAKGVASQFVRGANDVSTLEGESLVADHVRQVLMTRAGDQRSSGELPWRQSFGSQVHRLRHRGINDQTFALARALVLQALQQWVPEIQVISVTAAKDVAVERAIRIRVTYQILNQAITESVGTVIQL